MQDDGSGMPLAAVITSTTREAMREERSLRSYSKPVGLRSQGNTVDQQQNDLEAIDSVKYRVRPAVATRSNHVSSNPSTDRRWNRWLLIGTLSLYRQCQNTQEAYQATENLARERFGVSFASSISFLTGFPAHLVRDSRKPQIYISLTWWQCVPHQVLCSMTSRKGMTSGKGLDVKQEVESGRLSVNAYDEYGRTLLRHVAVFEPRMVTYLLDHGADAHATDVSGWYGQDNLRKRFRRRFPRSSLRAAMLYFRQVINSVSSFRFLVEEADVDPVITSEDGPNFLHDVAFYCDLRLVNSLRPDFFITLSSYCPGFNAKAVSGHTPLFELIRRRDRWFEEVFSWFVSNGTD
ncbi:MAG: hypothetical protein M1830_005969, partial [Pleopsidium flavum]